MELVSLLVLIIAVIALVILAVWIIDKTFTGGIAQFAWIAKIIVGMIALVIIVAVLLNLGGVNFGSVRIGR